MGKWQDRFIRISLLAEGCISCVIKKIHFEDKHINLK